MSRSKEDRDFAFGEAVYEAYRRGYDCDLVSRDQVGYYYDQTGDAFDAARMEVNRIGRHYSRKQEEQEEQEEQNYEQEYTPG